MRLAEAQPGKATLILGWCGALLLFAWLAQEVRRGGTQAWDDRIRMLVHAHATPALTAVMRGFSLIGEPAYLIVLGALVVVWLLRTGRWRTAVLLFITVLGSEVLDQAIKASFRRPRPVPFFGLVEPMGYSFPSGHAMVSCTFFGILAAIAAARTASRVGRVLSYAAAAALVAAIGLSRIYLGVHYPSDVLAGYAAAVAWVFIVAWARRLPPLP